MLNNKRKSPEESKNLVDLLEKYDFIDCNEGLNKEGFSIKKIESFFDKDGNIKSKSILRAPHKIQLLVKGKIKSFTVLKNEIDHKTLENLYFIHKSKPESTIDKSLAALDVYARSIDDFPTEIQRVESKKFSTKEFETKDGLRKYQQLAIKEVSKCLDHESLTCYVKMATGTGKTEVFLKIAKAVLKSGSNVLIIVPSINLINQTSERCKKYFPEIKVGKFYGDEKSIKQLTVATYSSLKDTLKSSDFNKMGLIILDESHRSLSTTNINELQKNFSLPFYEAQLNKEKAEELNKLLSFTEKPRVPIIYCK